ncbi:MAG: Uma2 family endonuclease [Thermosynechococcaceae cyanobacterium]
MVQALPQRVTFEEFTQGLPESSEERYELHRGVIVAMPKPRGKHSEVAGFINGKLFTEIERQQLPYFIPRECLVRSQDGASGYEPDVIVLDRGALRDEPLWERESIITLGKSVKLIIEVVSTNWQDDYLYKLADYQALGIQEYWIVDYAALGGRIYIGNPKQPTLSVYTLMEDGEYNVQPFRESSSLLSMTFPDLTLSVAQVFQAKQGPL